MFYLFLILIFIRPFISSLISPELNLIHSALLLFLLIIWIIVEKYSLKKLRALQYPFILFCIALIISTIFSQNKLISFAESYKYVIPLLMLWAITNLDHEKRQVIAKCLVWAGFIIGLIALRQYFIGFGDTLKYMAQEKINDPYALVILQRNRVFSPFVTPDVLASYLIMMLPLVVLLRDRLFLGIPVFLALLLTSSLGALLSLLLSTGIYFYANRKLGRKAILGLAGFMLVVIAIFVVRHGHTDAHMNPLFSLGMRLSYWRDTLDIIKGHLLTGVGMGNFDLFNSRYAHNAYLQIWAEAGMLGIISFIWLLVEILRNKRRFSILAIAVTVFLVHNFIDFTFFLPETLFIWWMIVGLYLTEDETADQEKPFAVQG